MTELKLNIFKLIEEAAKDKDELFLVKLNKDKNTVIYKDLLEPLKGYRVINFKGEEYTSEVSFASDDSFAINNMGIYK